MKLKSIVWRSLVGVACMSFMLGTAAAGEKKKTSKSKTQYSVQQDRPTKPGVKEWHSPVFVELTGSRIPQRVIVRGQQVNSASPVYVVEGEDLHRTGSTSILGMLSLDPSITSAARRH